MQMAFATGRPCRPPAEGCSGGAPTWRVKAVSPGDSAASGVAQCRAGMLSHLAGGAECWSLTSKYFTMPTQL